jgi:hypothetical protein
MKKVAESKKSHHLGADNLKEKDKELLREKSTPRDTKEEETQVQNHKTEENTEGITNIFLHLHTQNHHPHPTNQTGGTKAGGKEEEETAGVLRRETEGEENQSKASIPSIQENTTLLTASQTE